MRSRLIFINRFVDIKDLLEKDQFHYLWEEINIKKKLQIYINNIKQKKVKIKNHISNIINLNRNINN